MAQENILIWLPSPLGDAVLCTAALGALRKQFESAHICYLANSTVHQVLSPSRFCNEWIDIGQRNTFSLARQLRQCKFSKAILFKNSFGSALTVFLGGANKRIGYARDFRKVFLTDNIRPARNPDGSFKPVSMVDYYLGIAKWLGCQDYDRATELTFDDRDAVNLKGKLENVCSPDNPLVILVPGGAFGLSKCWPADRFAETADRVIEKYNATVVISVAPNDIEKSIAEKICRQAKNKLYNLAETPVTLGELKALIGIADLVITNDTGPRHIAVALRRKVISLFGPNDPAWTDTGYKDEMQISGTAQCAPCQKPKCKEAEHLCMNSISVEMVFSAAQKMLDENRKEV